MLNQPSKTDHCITKDAYQVQVNMHSANRCSHPPAPSSTGRVGYRVDHVTILSCLAGGLLNATFGNVVELILSIIALIKGLYDLVAYSLIGSVLSNLLLVLGEISGSLLTPLHSRNLLAIKLMY